ncbi:MAG: TRAP transporter fused permease subunit [Proteobacteria bacterium]|nr:TRAP transporter fused permease subunit [Pseudomonadota bacterium]
MRDAPRTLATAVRWATLAVALAMSSYHLATGNPLIGPPIAQRHYPIHLGFALLVLFGHDLARALGERRHLRATWDVSVIALTFLSDGYLVLYGDYVANRMTFAQDLTPVEIVLGITLLVMIIEAARRTIGAVLIAVGLAFFFYAYFGFVLPEPFWHPGFTLGRIVELAYMTQDGIWNAPMRVSADYIFLFILFGTLLAASGAGTFFTDLAHALTGRTIGGPAKTAVVASAFFGMLSGSATANAVTTGAFTIPAMKRSGYRPEFAAAVEAVASTGGQFMPPVMGATAFLMAEFVGIPYLRVMGYALIPAILFFFAVFVVVDVEARRLRLAPLPEAEIPDALPLVRKRGYLLLAVVVLLLFLLEGYTATAAAFWSTVTLAALVAVFDAESRRRIGRVLFEAMTEAPRMIAPVTVACGVGGFIAGMIVMGGLGIRMSGLILDFSGGSVLIALVLTFVVAVILGMGMPTAGAYIILAALLVPGLVRLGVNEVAAHLFTIFCCATSGITPPVAVTSFAAAGLANTDPWRTSWVAIKLGLPVFILPFMFVYGLPLLGMGSPIEIAAAIASASIGLVLLPMATFGWFRIALLPHERLIAAAAAFSMIFAGWRTDLLGVGLGLLFVALVHIRRRLRGARAARDGVLATRLPVASRANED